MMIISNQEAIKHITRINKEKMLNTPKSSLQDSGKCRTYNSHIMGIL
jgi:hypothetical protein